MDMKRKFICAAMAAVMLAGIMAGCAEKTAETNDNTQNNSVAAGAKTDENNGADTETTTGESGDPLTNAEAVAKLYLEAAGAEYDETMNDLMTKAYSEQYQKMQESAGHDDAYDDHSDVVSDVKYQFSDECKLIDAVHIDEHYTNCAELYVNVTYVFGGEAKSSDQYLLAAEIDGKWKICFAGTKSQAYAEGMIMDTKSGEASENAKAVYDAAVAAYTRLTLKGKYKFEYMNYISTENDDFINEIKNELPEELKNSFFTVFMEVDETKEDKSDSSEIGAQKVSAKNVSYVIWAEQAGSEVMVTYPEK